MTPTTISVISLVLSVVINIIAIAYFFGKLSERVSGLKKDITRLEEKQDKHNSLIERMALVEQSTKSAHHRIDDMKEKK